MNLLASLILAISILIVSGQAHAEPSDWPQYLSDASRTGHNPDETTLTENTIQSAVLRWKVQHPGVYFRTTDPMVYGGAVYYTVEDTLYVHALKTGNLLWQYKLPKRVSTTPAIAGDLVYLPTLGGTLYTININTRELAWQTKLGDKMLKIVPTISDDIVLIISGDQRLNALKADTGERIWAKELSDNYVSIMAASEGVTYYSNYAQITARNENSGNVIWKKKIADIGRAVLVADGFVFGKSVGAIHALKAGSGKIKWSAPATDTSARGIALADRLIYLVGSTEFQAFDALSGAQVASKAVPGHNAVYGDPAVAGNVIYNTSIVIENDKETHKVLAFNRQGDLLRKFPADDWASSPVIADGHLLYTDERGALYAWGLP